MSVKTTSMRGPACRRAIASSAVLDFDNLVSHRSKLLRDLVSHKQFVLNDEHDDLGAGSHAAFLTLSVGCDALSRRAPTVGTYDFLHSSRMSEK